MYVSITGLRLNSFLYAPKFMYYAVPSMIQAQSAEGNVMAQARNVDGVHHTLSVWEDRKSMLKYLRSSDHAKAMKIFDDIATGKTYGYEIDSAQEIPTWEEAVELYNTKGREVGKAGREKRAAERRGEACPHLAVSSSESATVLP